MSTHFFDLDREQLRSFVVEHGLRRFVADQLQEWVYHRGVTELDRMTNVSRRDRERLGELVHFESARLITERCASDGTRKLLLGWTMLEANCPVTGSCPLMRDTHGRDWSAALNAYVDDHEAAAAAPAVATVERAVAAAAARPSRFQHAN